MKKHTALLMVLLAGCSAFAEDYGAEKANTTFFFDQKQLGGTDDFNYLALRDHIGPSGVPLGGIGVGFVNLAPDGRFTRIGVTNAHHVLEGDAGAGSFFAIWAKTADGKTRARRLVRDSESFCGMTGYEHSTYTGLFPRAQITFDDGDIAAEPVQAVIHAYSGLVPQNVKDSSLPVIWFDVHLRSKQDAQVSIALSWEDFIGRGIYDPTNLDPLAGQLLEARRAKRVNAPEEWPLMPRVRTAAQTWGMDLYKGIQQYAIDPMAPNKYTFQNYVNEFVVLAEGSDDTEITALPAYTVREPGQAWDTFAQDGTFAKNRTAVPLSQPDFAPTASVVAAKTRVRAGEVKILRFMVVWFMPEFTLDRNELHPGSYWGTGDYNRYFHNYFDDITALSAYAVQNRARILTRTQEWQTHVLDSSYPDWLKFKVINSAYTLYTNPMLNQGSDFTVMEGAMGGLAGTMDQRISAHPFYQKFFTQLDRSEMQLFADCQDESGFILHFIGHYYVGMATKGGPAPTMGGTMLDNTGGWIIQLAKDYQQTGDMDYLLHNAGRVRNALANLKASIPDKIAIPVGSTTYDDYQHPPIYCYMAGMYLATLNAGEVIGKALNDAEMVRDCRAQFAKTRDAARDYLWNNRFFAYGCELDGSGRRDDILFTGQLGGQFVSRYCGWGDVYPLDVVQASLISQFKTSLYHTPDYYANKVWDLNAMKGIDRPGSQCWPFYLESYTAYTGIQAGYLADGLDIMKHIQLVHMRKGWTWTQNLWNPGPVTYMTMPVTWFFTDVITGAGLDVPSQTLRLAPAVLPGDRKLSAPIFFPTFWAMLDFEPEGKQARLRILKTFGNERITLSRIVSEPIGKPTAQGKSASIPAFVVETGAVLDLSPWWDTLAGAVTHDAVLPRAKDVPFKTVEWK